MVDYRAIAKQIGAAFTAANCTVVEFTRPVTTSSLTARTVAKTTPAGTRVRGFILPASKGTLEAFDNRLEDDAFKGKQFRFLKLAACDLSVVPQAMDQFVFQGQTWRALGCTPIDIVGGVPLVHGVGVVST